MLKLPMDALKELDKDAWIWDFYNKEQRLYTICVDLKNLKGLNDNWYRIMYSNNDKQQRDSFITWLDGTYIT